MTKHTNPEALIAFAKQALAAVADPMKAGPMAAYMKTEQPFYGVPKPERQRIERDLQRRFPIHTQEAYETAILGLWSGERREEQYLATAVARQNPAFVGLASLPLYERMIREGAWWDLVDDVATRLVGGIWMACRAELNPVMDTWIQDRVLWIRRSALIAQNRHKGATDEERLFRYCLRCADENAFFIRKAIGWALREYSYTAPERVAAFADSHRDVLSGLSYREAVRVLKRRGEV